MSTLLVTGASGYIGRHFVVLAEEAGHTIVSLGSPARSERTYPWRLGELLPQEVFRGVDAVVHLAHSWNNETVGAAVENINLFGSTSLVRAALVGGVERIVFVSSVSARPQALNVYGRVKYLTEQQLLSLPQAQHSVFCARVGLVYGGKMSCQYGLLRRLAGLTPVLPMVGLSRRVQPIHIDEVCKALLSLALGPPLTQTVYVLASPVPMRFSAWLRLLRYAETGKGLILIPLPVGLVLPVCRLLTALPFVPKIDRERILGLASTQFCPSAKDLNLLGLSVGNPAAKLTSPQLETRNLIGEAKTLLHYLLGHSPPRKAVIRLVWSIQNCGDAAFRMPRLFLWRPALLCFLDPMNANSSHILARHIHFAAMVAEAMPRGSQVARDSGYLALFVQLILEVAALPFRLYFGRVQS